jgi:hypothetical protein
MRILLEAERGWCQTSQSSTYPLMLQAGHSSHLTGSHFGNIFVSLWHRASLWCGSPTHYKMWSSSLLLPRITHTLPHLWQPVCLQTWPNVPRKQLCFSGNRCLTQSQWTLLQLCSLLLDVHQFIRACLSPLPDSPRVCECSLVWWNHCLGKCSAWSIFRGLSFLVHCKENRNTVLVWMSLYTL